MNKEDFKQAYSLIQALAKDAYIEKPSIEQNLGDLNTKLSNLLKHIEKRYSFLDSYLKTQQEFSDKNNVSSPLEQFPGIRTAAQMADPEELLKTTGRLKQQARDIDSYTKMIEAESQSVILCIKRLLSLVSEFTLKNNNLYDTYLDLLNDMDSDYDTGHLSSSTK